MVRISPIETLHLVLGNLITSKRLRKPFPFDLPALGCFSMRFASTGEPKISCFSLSASLPGNVVGCIIDERVVEGVGTTGTVGRIVGLCVGIAVGIISVPPGMVIIISVDGGGVGDSDGGTSEVVRIGMVGSGPSGSVGVGSVDMAGSVGMAGISVISGGIGDMGGSSC